MSQLPRYENYKDSGVQWLGEIPSHWVRTNVKYYYDVQLGKMLQPEAKSIDDINIKYLKAQHVQWEKIDSENMPEMWCSSKELSKYMVSNGDLLICEGGEVGRCGILTNLEEPAIIQNALHRVRNTARADVRYLNYFIQHTAESDWFSILCNKATIAHFTSEKLLALPTLIPPLGEQKIIAGFLDKRLAQVDALIAKQETLLEKLAEQRVALISHAVTKGLNPDADFIMSKNAWLGEIPKDWILKPTKYFLSYVGSGKTPKGGAEVYIDEGVIMIRSQNVHDEGLRLEDVVHITDEADQGQINTRVYEDDVLLNITGASLGRVSLVPKGISLANVNQHVCILRPIKSLILPQFLHLIMQSHYAKSLIKSEENGTSREGLTFEQIKAMVFALPPIDEQQTICEKIQSDLEDLNKSKNYCENLIKKLKEYRSTLITQVVTGKIDVRNLKLN
ncbi:restriction endonuclease subunit S [Acinetobacter baumannii]|uniref:restriction endonuclease subunit S n=1 Tax=Acinetobacter baumannii TaxID=470 RepID=UPI0022543194|nr:restriction endonuclease subunit S [Acinetobacter baumannii]MCX3036022.1 restriction endonuclease subunit S [Acinetobacter baumannii]